MKLTIGFSPCPNDTFIFDALVNGRINTKGLQYEAVMEDVQTLNEWAIEGKLDVTKISFGVLPLVLKHYLVMDSGSALGKGVGPLVIHKNKIPLLDINFCTIALPGENTTAHLLFAMACPDATNKIFMRYDEIEDFVLQGEGSNHAGVIIHENRFTYQEKGLHALLDLGNYWEEKTTSPIPLGGIVVKRTLEIGTQKEVELQIRESILMAYMEYPRLSIFVKQHAREMSEHVMRSHIDLYVNEYSRSIGSVGQEAIIKLLNIHQKIYTGKEVKPDEVFLTAAN